MSCAIQILFPEQVWGLVCLNENQQLISLHLQQFFCGVLQDADDVKY